MLKKRYLLSKFVLVILLICVLILPFQLSCASVKEKVQDISYRMVQIVLVQIDGEETIGITSIGTGFILNNDGYVITSGDIIAAGEQLMQDSESRKMAAVIPAPSMVAGNQYSGFATTNDFEVVDIDDEHNLVLLKLEFASGISPGFGNRISSVHYHNHVNGTLEVGTADFTGRISEGNSIAIWGFPSDEFVAETITGKITSGEIEGVYNTNITSGFNLSGSPAYSPSTGKIIGMCICKSSGETSIVPASCIKNLLNSN